MVNDREAVGFIEKFFSLSSRNTSISVELRAGLSTFLTMCYILLVNPQILSQVGITPTDVVFSTAIASSIATFYVGIVG